ncbi:MAG: hypothetical protein IPG67_17005 [Acidobacteria bacterium]|nr:hypothetical protein [Acidobacteriota bacterium]
MVRIRQSANESGLPIFSHRLTPEVADTFWAKSDWKRVSAPKSKFRWCTERLKIKPSNQFIKNVVKENGEAIVVLGTRKSESLNRARSMEKLERKQVREQVEHPTQPD